MQREIPELGQALSWLPDETLFSLASRYHALSGAIHPWVTCEKLFGHRRRGSAHDFPSCIDEFAASTEGLLGDGPAIAAGRTLLQFYLPWRRIETGREAIAALRGQQIGSLKYLLGLLTSRFGAQHPLKACPRCIEEDSRHFGMAYWHRTHQWPGVWACPDHGCAMKVSKVKVDGEYRYAWALPRLEALVSPFSEWRARGRGDGQLLRLTRLADMSAAACASGPGAFSDVGTLRTVYRSQMVKLAWIDRVDRLNWNVLEHVLQRHLEALSGLPEFARLTVGPHPLRAHLSLLLYDSSAQTHPLRHLLLIEALFPSWQAFLHSHSEAVRNPVELPAAPSRTAGSLQRPTMDVTGTESARQLSREQGVDVHTAMVWRAAAGIAPSRRPKTLKAPVLSRMVVALQAGMSKEEAALQASVSVTTVTRILRTEPGLQSQWHRSRWLLKQQEARAAWSQLLQSRAGMPMRLLRMEAPAAFAWLYRNDRDWLTEQMRLRDALPAVGNHVLAKWRGKDEHLAQEIRSAAVWLAERGVLTLARLQDAVPELAPHLRRLDRLPTTQVVLLAVLQHPRACATLGLRLDGTDSRQSSQGIVD